MTSIDTNNLDQAIVQFQSLPVEEQLAALGGLFKGISGSIPASGFGAISDEVAPLIDQIKGQRQDEQLQTLSDLITSKATKDDEVALDPHPSQALLELLPGSTQPPLKRYESLDANSRLAFWYQLGQALDGSIPADASPSSKANELFESLRSLGVEQQAAFLSKLV